MTRMIALFIALLLLVPTAQAAPALGVKEAYKMAKSGEIVLIDIRDPSEWKQTGVGEHAKLISMHRPGFLKKIKQVRQAFMGKPLAVICAHANRSKYIANALPQYGFKGVIDVRPGMEGPTGWIKAGLPTKKWSGK